MVEVSLNKLKSYCSHLYVFSLLLTSTTLAVTKTSTSFDLVLVKNLVSSSLTSGEVSLKSKGTRIIRSRKPNELPSTPYKKIYQVKYKWS